MLRIIVDSYTLCGKTKIYVESVGFYLNYKLKKKKNTKKDKVEGGSKEAHKGNCVKLTLPFTNATIFMSRSIINTFSEVNDPGSELVHFCC